MRVVLFSLGFGLLLAAGPWFYAGRGARPPEPASDCRMPLGSAVALRRAGPPAARLALAALGAAALAAAYWP